LCYNKNMKNKLILLAAPLLLLPVFAFAQATPSSGSAMVVLPGTASYLPAGVQEVGPVAPSTAEQSVLLVLTQTAQQKADEQEFLNELQDPKSPNFHQWLTPAQYNARFGPSSAEVATITQWLLGAGFTNIQPQGLTMSFDGTAGQLESAFGISINNYIVNGKQCEASPDNQSVPANIASFTDGFSISDCFPPVANMAAPNPIEGNITTGISNTQPSSGGVSMGGFGLPLFLGIAALLLVILAIVLLR
jgi:subtilase family serine protease